MHFLFYNAYKKNIDEDLIFHDSLTAQIYLEIRSLLIKGVLQ